MSHLSFLNASIRHARESTYAKASLGTVPGVPVASVNRNRVVVKEFRSTLRAACHESILGCYQAYNRKGECIVPMQSGSSLYFPRACILAICRPTGCNKVHVDWKRLPCVLYAT